MLMILCYAETNRYALDAQHVEEIVPRVSLRRAPQSPPWFAGQMIHRGRTAPVLDLCALVAGSPCPSRLGNRIILLRAEWDGAPRRLGILAERVTLKEMPANLAPASEDAAGHGQLGRLLLDEEGLFEWIDMRLLLCQERCAALFPALEGERG